MPPSFNELKKRLLYRNTESHVKINERILAAQKEILIGYNKYYYVIKNNNINNTILLIQHIIRKYIII